MTRRIVWEVPQAAVAGAQPQKADDRLDRIANYIPGEVIALWALLTAIVQVLPPESHLVLLWTAAGVCFVLTPIYVWFRIAKKDEDTAGDQPIPWNELILSTISFAFWVFAIGGPFAKLDWYHPGYGSFAVAIWSAISGFIPRLTK